MIEVKNEVFVTRNQGIEVFAPVLLKSKHCIEVKSNTETLVKEDKR